MAAIIFIAWTIKTSIEIHKDGEDSKDGKKENEVKEKEYDIAFLKVSQEKNYLLKKKELRKLDHLLRTMRKWSK